MDEAQTTSLGATRRLPVDLTLLYLIKQVELAVRARLDQAVRPAGLSVAQYTALTVLARHPRMTSAQLARNSFVRAQTMAQITTFLEERDLIERQVDPNSQRQHFLSLTGKAVALLESLRPAIEQIEVDMLQELPSDDVRALREALHSCRIALGGTRAR